MNLCRPADRSWCVGSEIDLAFIDIAGCTELVEALCAGGRIEALSASPGDLLTRVEPWMAGRMDGSVTSLLTMGEATVSTCRGEPLAHLKTPRQPTVRSASRPERSEAAASTVSTRVARRFRVWPMTRTSDSSWTFTSRSLLSASSGDKRRRVRASSHAPRRPWWTRARSNASLARGKAADQSETCPPASARSLQAHCSGEVFNQGAGLTYLSRPGRPRRSSSKRVWNGAFGHRRCARPARARRTTDRVGMRRATSPDS